MRDELIRHSISFCRWLERFQGGFGGISANFIQLQPLMNRFWVLFCRLTHLLRKIGHFAILQASLDKFGRSFEQMSTRLQHFSSSPGLEEWLSLRTAGLPKSALAEDTQEFFVGILSINQGSSTCEWHEALSPGSCERWFLKPNLLDSGAVVECRIVFLHLRKVVDSMRWIRSNLLEQLKKQTWFLHVSHPYW